MRVFSAICLSASATLCCMLVLSGCSDDKEEAAKLSRKGESCQLRADCEEGLACVQNVCITSEFAISPTAKECAVIECQVPADCCPTQDAYCTSLSEDCQGGDTYACEYYDSYCKCDPNSYACENNTCRGNSACQSGSCASPYHCDTNTNLCVECLNDTHCYSDSEVCRNGECVIQCKLDSDCPYFNRCQNGDCIESGCQSDRECKAATGNALAICANAACSVPCQTNLECGSPESDFNFEACVNGQCTYMGCESDKECQLYLGVTGNAANMQVVCRDKPAQ